MITDNVDPLPWFSRTIPTRVRASFGSWTSQFYENLSQNAAGEDALIMPTDKDDSGEHEHQDPKSTQVRAVLTRRVIILSALAGCVVLLLSTIMVMLHQARAPKIWESCGDNPEMARSRGCQFDVINFALQTRECFDASLVAEFAEVEPWTFWKTEDNNSNETVPQYVEICPYSHFILRTEIFQGPFRVEKPDLSKKEMVQLIHIFPKS